MKILEIKTNKRPVHSECMTRQCERFEHLGVMAKIPAVLTFQCEIVLTAYYGSYFCAGLHLIGQSFYWAWHNLYWNFVHRICDWMGWTQLYRYPVEGWRGQFVRHGKLCDGSDCENCIDKSVPKWFKKLTRWDNYKL